MTTEMVAQVRRFNRTVTQRIGALHDEFRNTDRSLGASRLLYEIGAEGADVRTLRRRLDLDSGYVSRLLRTLERNGLIVVEQRAVDRRVRTALLTPAGRQELTTQDTRSDDAAQTILATLNPAQRERLVA